MKVIILSAGLGKRLDNPLGAPKALTLLENGSSILGWQLKFLSYYIDLNLVTVVVGYHFEEIIKAFPSLNFFYNPDFAQENTAGSLKRAVKSIDEDLLWLNGDVIFHPYVIKTLLNFRQNAMIVNKSSVGEEEVKYATDGRGKILQVSKKILQAEGEALGINFISQKDLGLFKHMLESCSSKDYFEKAIEESIQKGMAFTALPVESWQCCEIDFPEDLHKANEMVKSWKIDETLIAR